MKTNALFLVVLLCALVGCATLGSAEEKPSRDSDDAVHQLLTSVAQDDLDLRRQSAAEICIVILKKNCVWRAESLNWGNWKIPTEDRIRGEAIAVCSSKQRRDLALANMCGHCMGMLNSGTWRTPPVEKIDSLEERLVSIVQATDDPVVKIILLVGLASSPTTAARDAIVAATSDAELGVRTSANFLVQRCTANAFGPLGVICSGSPASDVDAAGQKIRSIYEWDKTIGAGWGPMEGGLQTRLATQPTVARVGMIITGSLTVRNVSDEPKSVPNRFHPVLHLRITHNKKYIWPKVEPVPGPLAAMTLAPGEQKTLWSFRLNDFIDISNPGRHEMWLRDTDGWLSPMSNRVLFGLETPSQTVRRSGEDTVR